MKPTPEQVRAFMAELEIGVHRAREVEAIGWVYVTVDLESGAYVHAVGPFEKPEDAFLAAGVARREDERFLDAGEVGWGYHVVPLMLP